MKPGQDADLDAQLAQVREVVREAHGAVRDLRQAMRDARGVLESLDASRIAPAVDAELRRMRATMQEATEEAVSLVFARFDQLTNLLLTGSKNGRGKAGVMNMEGVIRRIGAGEQLTDLEVAAAVHATIAAGKREAIAQRDRYAKRKH